MRTIFTIAVVGGLGYYIYNNMQKKAAAALADAEAAAKAAAAELEKDVVEPITESSDKWGSV